MRKTLTVLMVATMLGLWFVARPAQAQEESKEGSPAAATKAKPPLQPYRLDFSFNEVLEGKIVNTRHYSMNLSTNDGEPSTVKIGTRVPVVSGSSGPGTANTQYQYIDVGTDLWAQLRGHGEDWELVVHGEVSNLDMEASHPGELAPIIRQIKINGNTLLVVGKPILIGSVDDPNSKRQFQLEVTVTKLR
jgi:hypothetical protein